MPAVSPVIDGVTVTDPAPVPLLGETDSHGALSEALQLSVPPPVLETPNVFAAGEAPPCTLLKASEAGDTDRAGGAGGSTVKVTPIVRGEPDAPVADTVMSVV